MRHTPAALAGAVLAGLLAAGGDVRAEFVHWSYGWSRSPEAVRADSPGTGSVTLTDEGLRSAAGDSDVVATNLRTWSTAGADRPDRFTARPFALRLFLLDQASGKSGALTFTGRFDGTLTAESANLRATFTGRTTQALVLGDHLYRVSIGPYTPPGPPRATNAGSIGAHARVTAQSIFPTLPEPGTLALACLGACGLGLAYRRRARPQRLAP
jgi:hypothetical protein